MTKVKKQIQNYEGRKIEVLFAHRCRAKTNAGIARLLNAKYIECPPCGLDDFYTADDVADMLLAGFIEQRDGYIYVLGWC